MRGTFRARRLSRPKKQPLTQAQARARANRLNSAAQLFSRLYHCNDTTCVASAASSAAAKCANENKSANMMCHARSCAGSAAVQEGDGGGRITQQVEREGTPELEEAPEGHSVEMRRLLRIPRYFDEDFEAVRRLPHLIFSFVQPTPAQIFTQQHNVARPHGHVGCRGPSRPPPPPCSCRQHSAASAVAGPATASATVPSPLAPGSFPRLTRLFSPAEPGSFPRRNAAVLPLKRLAPCALRLAP